MKKSWVFLSVLTLIVVVILYFGAALDRSALQLKLLSKATKTITAYRMDKEAGVVRVDGVGGERIWEEAKETEIKLTSREGAEPKSVRIKAVYSDDTIYILAKYKDTTPLKLGEVWKYDGTQWKKGPRDDTLALVFNIDDSMPAFAANGFSVMDSPMTKEKDIFDFTYTESDKKMTDSERLDIWGWCGLPEFYGRGDDMVMKRDPVSDIDNLKSPMLTVQHDEHPNVKPWISNVAIVDGKESPRYKYKAGYDVKNKPRPYMDEVEEITDNSMFAAGDTAPYVIGIRNAIWGGSKDDILAKGTHPGDIWTVEMGRRLDTGHDDDILLKEGGSYTLVVVIRDDGKGYSISAPITLQL